MSDSYIYDQNGNIISPQQQQQQQVQQQVPSSQVSVWDYMRAHKVAVIVVLIILAILIWYFCIRKAEPSGTGTITVNVPSTGGPTTVVPRNTGIQLTKVRGAGMF